MYALRPCYDAWLYDLSSLTSNCKIKEDSCEACEPTRILGQTVASVLDEEDRETLLEKGPAMKLEDALNT